MVAGYALFWQIWSGRWARSAWWVLPLVGIMIGLAAVAAFLGYVIVLGRRAAKAGLSADTADAPEMAPVSG